MDSITGIGYAYAELFISILLVISVYLISRIFKMPFYFDPWGKKAVMLSNKLNPIFRLASPILSFLTFGKCKLLTSTAWRYRKIIEGAKSGISERLEVKMVVGECGSGLREMSRLALSKGYKVVMLSGPPYCDAVCDLKEFLKTQPKFELYIDKKCRPEKHFCIIGEENIFLEVPHHPYQEKKYSLGISKAKPEIVNVYTEKFDKMKEGMQKITSIEEFEEIVNKYCKIPPPKGKSWWQFGSCFLCQ